MIGIIHNRYIKFDVGRDDSYEVYVNLYTLFGNLATGVRTVSGTENLGLNNDTSLDFICYSCQRLQLPNYLKMHELRIR